ncbi:hypothetical protein [Halomonas heilongjiangensis]|uniref:hypothetical protein n=1 Tax=Halomonas heilongjiangensis TaxID=1387883 RepID=UPI0015E8E006|nr:hypothetical protein [Halomonas heilongjiangensis]
MRQLVMTSCLVRVALLAVVLGATVSDSARPMSEVSVSPPAPEVPALCLRDRPGNHPRRPSCLHCPRSSRRRWRFA